MQRVLMQLTWRRRARRYSRCRAGGVRYRFSADPTASAGLYHDDLRGPLVVTGRALLAAARFIRDANSTGTVTVDFELLKAV